MKKKQIIFIVSGMVLLIIIAVVFVLNGMNKPSLIAHEESPKTYHLENATDIDKFERMITVTLHSDGTAELPQPLISSFLLMSCKYSIVNGELIIYTGDSKESVAVFSVEDNNTLVFKSTTVPLFADIGARYIHETQN